MSTTTCRQPRCNSTLLHARGYCGRCYRKLNHARKLLSTLIDPASARELITSHLQRGRTISTLARASGVDKAILGRIHRGDPARVLRRTVRKLALTPLPPTLTGCRRRVHALQALGYTIPSIARVVGCYPSALSHALRQDQLGDHMAVAIGAAYQQLQHVRGSSALGAQRASRLGYAPPAAWDGIDIDDPSAVPDAGEATRRSSADLLAEYTHLTGLGVSPERALRQLGVKEAALERARLRATERTSLRGEAA